MIALAEACRGTSWPDVIMGIALMAIPGAIVVILMWRVTK